MKLTKERIVILNKIFIGLNRLSKINYFIIFGFLFFGENSILITIFYLVVNSIFTIGTFVLKTGTYLFLNPKAAEKFSFQSNKRKNMELLNLPDSYSLVELKKNYRNLAKKFHPDLSKSQEDLNFRNNKMSEINIAYNELKSL